jgi:DNA-binding NarL/FixJ family response regulator
MPTYPNMKASKDACATAPVLEMRIENQPVRAKAFMITAAERRVLTLVTRAKTNKEIALALGISPATVKRHLEKILAKLGLRNRVEAAIYGLMLNGCPDRSSSDCILRKLRSGSD